MVGEPAKVYRLHWTPSILEGVNPNSLFTPTKTLSLSTTEETDTIVSLRNLNLNLDNGVDGYIEFLEQFPKQFQNFVLNKNRSIFVLPDTGDGILFNLLIRTGSNLLTAYVRMNDLYFVAFRAEGKEMQLLFQMGEELFPEVTKGAWRQKDNTYALKTLSYKSICKVAQVAMNDIDLYIDGIKNVVIQYGGSLLFYLCTRAFSDSDLLMMISIDRIRYQVENNNGVCDTK